MLKLIQARERGIPHGMPLILMTLYFLQNLFSHTSFLLPYFTELHSFKISIHPNYLSPILSILQGKKQI